MIAVATFTDPRTTALSKEREQAIMAKHRNLVKELANEFEVLDVNAEMGKDPKTGNFGIDSLDESIRAAMISKEASGAVLGLWHWTESNLVTTFVREFNRPILLYADDDPAWAGATCLTSVGASLWESAINEYAVRHVRIKGNTKKVIKWAKAAEAAFKLSRKSILLFGAPYTLGMEHLMDDLPKLKRFVGDLKMLDQYLLVKGAEEALKNGEADRFYTWVVKNFNVEFDGTMLTPEVLKRQLGLYIAAKKFCDRNTAGVSVKCQPELSEVYGVTACFIPALLPFALDADGEKPVIPTTCEGDIKGTISSALLFYLSGRPPLFGDIKYVDDDVVVIANCGAASLYYSKLSEDPAENLKSVKIQPQCQGKSGGALTFRTPKTNMTFARLIRKSGNYYLLYFYSRGVEINEELEKKFKWGKQWPHTAVKNPLDKEHFIEVMGANHLSAVPGDFREELKFVGRIWGVKTVDLGKKDAYEKILNGC